MEKKFFFIFLFLSIIPLATAIEIDMKTNFSQGETLIAKISGNFYEAISKEDVVFNRGHVRTSIIPFVAEINNDFYIYARLLDKSPNDYSIVIENVKYIQGNKIIEEDISKNFSINENMADFSISPGFIITDKDFFIEVRNLQNDEISVNSIILKSGETKEINFEIEDFEKFDIIELSNENLKYEIPVYIFSKTEKKKEKIFRFEPSELDVSIATNSETFKIIYLRNIGEGTIEGISLTVSDSLIPYLDFSIDEISKIEENSSKKINVYFYSYDEEREIEGQITAVSGETYAYASVFLNFLKDYIPVNGEEIEDTFVSETCSELNGKICNPDQQCDGKIEYAIDGVCCIGTCTEIQESSTWTTIGWAIIIIVVVFLVWFYFKRYKGAKGISDLVRVLNRK